MKFFWILALAVLIFPCNGNAQDSAASPMAAVQPAVSKEEMDRRIVLSTEWHKLMPVSVRDQVNTAIDEVAKQQPENEQEVFRNNMRGVLNYQAIEKISIDAMAETYTEAELQAMVEYYRKPEAQSARKKDQEYMGKIYPEIIRMLDQAIMRVRTGGTGQ